MRRVFEFANGLKVEHTIQGQDFVAVCSCGKETVIFFNPETHEFYSPEGWPFEWDEEYNPECDIMEWSGWNCGEPGHFQMPTTPPDDWKIIHQPWQIPAEWFGHPFLYEYALSLR